MKSDVLEIVSRAEALPTEEREEIVSRLLATLDGEGDDLSAAAAWKAEIARRVEQFRSGSTRTIPSASVHERARAIYGIED